MPNCLFALLSELLNSLDVGFKLHISENRTMESAETRFIGDLVEPIVMSSNSSRELHSFSVLFQPSNDLISRFKSAISTFFVHLKNIP